MRRISRRSFLRFISSISIGSGVPLLAAAYGYGLAPYQIQVERVLVRSPRIPAELDGLTIGHLSDLHRSQFVSQYVIEQAVRILQAMSPDIIALTGDYVYGSGFHESATYALRDLSAPLGVFAILGNHDYARASDDDNRLAIEKAFMTVPGTRAFQLLRNEERRVTVRGVPLHIVGVDDLWQGTCDLDQALMAVPRDRASILLVHEPDFADEAAAQHPFMLQLSGHSHGGQVRLPFVGAPILPDMGRKYPIGLRWVQGMAIYTTRGIGMVSPPIRINCPPEVTLIRLVHA